MHANPSRPRRTAFTALTRAALCAALVAALAACDASSPTAAGDAPVDPASVEGASASLVNGARSGQGVPSLIFDPVLCEIARDYSRKMRAQGFMSHQDSAGAGVGDRLRAAGVRFSMAGENLANVSGTSRPADDAHRNLMASPTHRANILQERFTHVGVGVATDGTTYWMTQIFLRE